MNTTHDTADTWRDLRDELTPEQIEFIEDFENSHPAVLSGGVDRDRVMLERARTHARDNKHDREHFGHIPTPGTPLRISAWEPEHDDDTLGPWLRTFDTAEWCVRLSGEPQGANRAYATLAGTQHDDGRIERWVYADAVSVRVTGEQARKLAAVLLEAADELDKLYGPHAVATNACRASLSLSQYRGVPSDRCAITARDCSTRVTPSTLVGFNAPSDTTAARFVRVL